MAYDYFYGQQSEQFSFYRIPKILFSQDILGIDRKKEEERRQKEQEQQEQKHHR